MKQYFEQQIEGGATDNFFYVIENNGKVSIERHRGTLDTLSINNLEFIRMSKSTPVFRPCAYDEQGGEQGRMPRFTK
jgi:hypothetical protein